MAPEKKAFKVVYGLIIDNLLTEKEAFNLIEGIFQKEYYPVPVPTAVESINQENPQEEAPKKIEEVKVRGFVNNH